MCEVKYIQSSAALKLVKLISEPVLFRTTSSSLGVRWTLQYSNAKWETLQEINEKYS